MADGSEYDLLSASWRGYQNSVPPEQGWGFGIDADERRQGGDLKSAIAHANAANSVRTA